MDRDGLRVGVVGCGYWGSKHVRVLHSVETVANVVLIDANSDRLRPLSRSFPASAGFATLESALSYLDAVVIATPASSHVDLALRAIEAGKHVLVEKPLATTTAGARALVDASAAASVTLMVGHTFEYNAAVWKLRDLVQGRALGDIYHVNTARLNLGLYQHDVNVIFDLAPHDVSIISHVLGTRPVAVEAWGSRHAHKQLEDVAYLRLLFDDANVLATVHVSWLDPCKVRQVTVVGSKTMAVYNDLAAEERIRIYDKGVVAPSDDQNLTVPPMSYRYGDILVPYVAGDEPLTVQDRHFVDCVLEGRRPLTDGESGLNVVRALECAQISIRERRRVHLDEAAPEFPAYPDVPAPAGRDRSAATLLTSHAAGRQRSRDQEARPGYAASLGSRQGV